METSDSQSNPNAHGMSRREALKRGLLGGAGLASLGSISSLLALADAHGVSAHELDASKSTMTKLIAAAKKEGALNTIALPPDWANYGEIMQTFHSKYGITLTNSAPDDTSAQENQSIVTLKGQSRGPDAVDVTGSIALEGKKSGLYQPYKVSTWSTIPKSLKDSAGYYYGDYWGAMSFLSLNSVVKQAPKDWSDLLSPTLRNMVAIDGPPTTAGDAFGAVFAAALANGGSLNNIQPGIDFFVKLKKAGNWNPADCYTATILKGATPVAIKWDYLNLAVRDQGKAQGMGITVNIPKSGVYGGPYYQAISKYAPNPNAAKLWMEFLYSDQGQLLWLKGYTHPARYLDLAKRKKIPAALSKKLPPASAYSHVKFASLTQIANAQQVLQEQWSAKMG
jgi:putative spermidine/putrescine transport system substrate-binding protein